MTNLNPQKYNLSPRMRFRRLFEANLLKMYVFVCSKTLLSSLCQKLNFCRINGQKLADHI